MSNRSEGLNAAEHRRVVEQLHWAEHRLALAQRIAKLGHWGYDLALNETIWSDTLYEILGVDAGSTLDLANEFLARIHPDDRIAIRADLQRTLAEGARYQHHYRVIRGDGAIREAYGAGEPRYDDDGAIAGMVGLLQDVTDQRELERSLARLVERLSTLNAMGQAVASSLDPARVYERVLSAARDLLHADLIILFLHDKDELQIEAVNPSAGGQFRGQRIPDAVGIAGEAWTSGQPVWLSGEQCLSRRSQHLVVATGYEPGSIIAVPIRWQDETLGVLEAVHTKTDAFDKEAADTLQSVATWTAIALGKVRQHVALEQRVKESDAIAMISRALGETLEPQSILDLIANTTHDLVPRAEWTVIHLLRGRPERLHPVASAGVPLNIEDYILNPGEGIAGEVIAQGHLANVADVQAGKRGSIFAHNAGVRSLLVVPVQSRSRRLGTISVQCGVPGAFTPEDERLLTILGAQAGLALENATLFDSQRRARAVAELQRERLRELTNRLVNAQEEERLRISRELHDEAGQALTSLKISIELIRAGLNAEQSALGSRLEDIAQLADETMESLRTLAHDLHPPGLETFGLNVALEGLCFDFGQRTNFPVSYNGFEFPELPATVALAMYRFVQEALTNIAKHARAQRVQVTMRREDEEIQLSVEDDGEGFELTEDSGETRQHGGLGLASMRERVALLGGTLQIETAPGHGTRLTARIPLDLGGEAA